MPKITREHIVTKIRLLAAKSNGSPPGRTKFASQTGIHEHTWSYYWARWSDALIEAGFKPNPWGRGYSDEEILKKLADFVRKLGRYPVGREIRVKSSREPGFPSENAFRRFGGRRFLARRLRDYSLANGYQDIVPLCESAAKVGRRKRNKASLHNAHGEFVYVLKSGRFYKVSARKPIQKGKDKLPARQRTVNLIHLIKTDDPPGIAGYWRRRFANRRKRAGWFELSHSDVSALRKRKFM